jgi:hypothetical protein
MRTLTIALLAAGILSAQAESTAFKSELLVGIWKVNWDKTPAPNGRAPSALPILIREYRPQLDGYMLHTVLRAAPGSQIPELDLIGAVRYDNREYPTYNPARLADLFTSGARPAQTVSFKPTGPYSLEWADRTNGKITAGGAMELSPDGGSMTFISHGYDAEGKPTRSSALLYEKVGR